MKKIDFSLLDKLNARIDNSGGPPHDGDMDARVTKLELIAEKTSERLATIERDVEVIRSNYATKEDLALTKADLQAAIGAQTWRIITFVAGFYAALAASVYYIATHIK
jgi:hypothetical protein